MTPSRVYNWLNIIQPCIYPPRCLLCGAPGLAERDLCQDCLAGLPRIGKPCRQCGEPLPETAPAGIRCGSCQKQPPAFDCCIAPLIYLGAVPALVSGFKFHDRLACGRLLEELLYRHLVGLDRELPELIIPIPLHPSRLRSRGFNQALELARPLGQRLGVPVDYRSCRRSRVTQSQTELDLKQRRRNLRNAFNLAAPLPARHIALVDDVVTTGSTSDELARLLKRAGAERVEVWAAARALSGATRGRCTLAPGSQPAR